MLRMFCRRKPVFVGFLWINAPTKRPTQGLHRNIGIIFLQEQTNPAADKAVTSEEEEERWILLCSIEGKMSTEPAAFAVYSKATLSPYMCTLLGTPAQSNPKQQLCLRSCFFFGAVRKENSVSFSIIRPSAEIYSNIPTHPLSLYPWARHCFTSGPQALHSGCFLYICWCYF